MAYKQLITPNLNIPVTGGWCENAVERAFGFTKSENTGIYPTATAAWNAAIGKHTDRSLPGVYVPVYFASSSTSAGHIAILAPDGRVYSASTGGRHAFNIHSSIDDTMRFYGGKLTYRGWAEGVGSRRVVEAVATPAPVPTPTPTPAPAPDNTPKIGDRVTTTATRDQNGTRLNLRVINDGQSVFTEVNSKGNAVLRKGGVVRCGVPVNSLRKV